MTKNYWFVLRDKKLYSYKKQTDLQHKEIISLDCAYLKENTKDEIIKGKKLYSFMLIFPDKKRIYYLTSQAEKEKWVAAIKKCISSINPHDFYDIGKDIGKGKFGMMKSAIHKETGKEATVNMIDKNELKL